jgi:hypothetical protein
MAIDPLGQQNPTQLAAQRASDPAKTQDSAPTATPRGNDGDADDSVILSPNAAAAAGTSSNVPSGTLSADLLRTITARLATGHYNSESVADRIAGKLIAGGDV